MEHKTFLCTDPIPYDTMCVLWAKLLLSGPTLQSYEPQSPRLLCSWGFSRQEYWSGLPCPPPVDLPNPGIEPRSPSLQADSLPSKPPGKSTNAGVGCHSLLQGIFLTQGLNPSLPHCRQILYHLSHQGSPLTNLDLAYWTNHHCTD